MIDREAVRREIAPNASVMKIIGTALVAGPAMFLVFILTQAADENAEPGAMTIIALACGVIQATLCIPVGKMVSRLAGEQTLGETASTEELAASPALRLSNAYQTGYIVCAAMVEGGAFLCLIAHMMERSPWTLGMAVVLIGFNAIGIPSTDSIVDWVIDRLRQQEDEA